MTTVLFVVRYAMTVQNLVKLGHEVTVATPVSAAPKEYLHFQTSPLTHLIFDNPLYTVGPRWYKFQGSNSPLMMYVLSREVV